MAGEQHDLSGEELGAMSIDIHIETGGPEPHVDVHISDSESGAPAPLEPSVAQPATPDPTATDVPQTTPAPSSPAAPGPSPAADPTATAPGAPADPGGTLTLTLPGANPGDPNDTYTVPATDTNQDGRPDTATLDIDGDKQVDTWVRDTNADGKVDTIDRDTNKDGVPDQELVDTTEHGDWHDPKAVSEVESPAPAQAVPSTGNPEIDMINQGSAGMNQVAAEVWNDLRPGVPVPTAPDGTQLAPDLIFAQLLNYTHDPDVVRQLEQWIEQYHEMTAGIIRGM